MLEINFISGKMYNERKNYEEKRREKNCIIVRLLCNVPTRPYAVLTLYFLLCNFDLSDEISKFVVIKKMSHRKDSKKKLRLLLVVSLGCIISIYCIYYITHKT